MTDEAGSVWMLMTAGPHAGVAARLKAVIGAGARGEAVRHVALPDASPEALASAANGARLSYGLLYRDKYINREIEVRFQSETPLSNMHGRSADLAFALALIAAMGAADGAPVFNLPPVAATGILNEEGGVEAIEGLADKVAHGLKVLPAGAAIVFPRVNEAELPAAMRDAAATKAITLISVDRLEEALEQLGIQLSKPLVGSPFRGLEPFGVENASSFFGREQQIDELLALLRQRSTLDRTAILVEGESGAGKSSLVLAGLLPALLRRGLADISPDRFRWGVLQPHAVGAATDPERELKALAAAFAAAWRHDGQGGLSATGKAPAAVDAEAMLQWLRAGAGYATARFVLVLDDLGQWFDGRLQPATVAALCALIEGLAARGVWIVGVAPEAALQSPEAQPLASLFGAESRYGLGAALQPAWLEAMVHEPAKAARLAFEPGLDTEIAASAGHGGGDVLPRLQLLLTELYEHRDQQRNLLRMAGYHSMGGLAGVIAARAEAAFKACSEEAQAQLPALLWRLALSGKILTEDYSTALPIRALLSAFRDRRLLVEDHYHAGEGGLRVAHDALFRQWPRASTLLSEQTGDMALWRALTREAGEWARGERTVILRGPQLEAVEAVYTRRMADWTRRDQPVINYLKAGLAHRARRRNLVFWGGGITASGLLTFGSLELYTAVRNARQTRIAFSDIALAGPDATVAAGPYLRRKGITISSHEPANAEVVIKTNPGDDHGAATGPPTVAHVLTQQSDPAIAPVSFTLTFAKPVKQIWFLRSALHAASGAGATGPAWTATALDADGEEIVHGGEDLLRSVAAIPEAWVRLVPPQDKLIAAVKILSDGRLNGKLFAGSEAVLIQEIQLWH